VPPEEFRSPAFKEKHKGRDLGHRRAKKMIFLDAGGVSFVKEKEGQGIVPWSCSGNGKAI